MRATANAIAVSLALLAFAGCQGAASARSVVDAHLAKGEVAQAYWLLFDHCNRNPDDVEARQQLNRLRVMFHLTQGQAKVFDDKDWSAVEDFERVLLVDPDNAVAKEWRAKALDKLAERETTAGDDARARGKLQEAIEHYHKAMTYVAEYPEAVRGATLVNDVFQARREKGQDNYMRGMRAQAAGLYEQTAYHMQIAIDNDPSMQAARDREALARRRIAEQRLEAGKQAEERGWFESALREYRAVQADHPTLDPEIATRIATVEREVEVVRKINEALALLYRREFGPARALLEEAYERSAEQRVKIAGHLLALREADLDQRYSAALDLELDYRHAEALAAYEAIDAGWPGQLDVRTRIQNLKTALDLARDAVARAEAAEAGGELEKALAAYREAITYAPRFLDVPQRIEVLLQRIEKAKADAQAPAGADKNGAAQG